MPTAVDFDDAQRSLETWLDFVATDAVVIERSGRPVAVLMDYDRYKLLEQQAVSPKRKLGSLKHIPLDIDEFLATPIPGIEEYE